MHAHINNQNFTDMKTLERVYYECHDQIYQHALSVVKNIHDAEDIRSDVYLKIQRLECAQFDESKKASLNTWAHTITNSVILDFFRTNHQEHYKAVSDFADGNDEEKTYFSFVAPESTRADSVVLASEIKNSVNNAIDELKVNYRRVAILYFLWDLPYTEISDIVNVPMGSVKGMLNRSRTRLQEALKGVYDLKPVKAEMSEA